MNKFPPCGPKGVESNSSKNDLNHCKDYCYSNTAICNSRSMVNVSDHVTAYATSICFNTKKFARDNITVDPITAPRQRVEEMVFLLHHTICYTYFQCSTCRKIR